MKTGTKLAFLGLTLAVACAGFWFYKNAQVDLPENRTAFVVVFLSAAALGVSSFVKGTSWVGALAALPAIVVGLFLPFTIAISRQEVAPNGIQVGDTIPHFESVDDRGEPFDSEILRGKPVLMKFFRAHW